MNEPSENLPFKNVYFIGIKGQGMCALAQVFQGWGVKVSGSDTEEEFSTDGVFKRLGIPVREGFQKDNVPLDCEAVFYSTAYGVDHPEVQRARELGKALYTYTDGLKMILERGVGIGVAGTHGKTTTTAMLGRILEDAGYDPTVIVGGKVLEWGANARVGRTSWVVAEADEYQKKFLEYPLRHLILTSVEYDHPDYFATPEAYEDCFRKLVEKISEGGIVVYNERYPMIQSIVSEYGKRVRTRLLRYARNDGLGTALKLQVPGWHNRENALAALTMAEALGVKREIVLRTLAHFQGTARRFEIYCEKPFVVVDDFAHHPGAIAATVEAAREKYPGRVLWVVFQPHTFSRTRALLNDFAAALSKADRALLLDIYGSARERSGGVHSKDLVARIPHAVYTPTLDDAANYLSANVKTGNVVIAMGAGDVWRVAKTLAQKFSA